MIKESRRNLDDNMHDSSPNENPFSEEGNPTPRNIPDRGLKDHNLM